MTPQEALERLTRYVTEKESAPKVPLQTALDGETLSTEPIGPFTQPEIGDYCGKNSAVISSFLGMLEPYGGYERGPQRPGSGKRSMRTYILNEAALVQAVRRWFRDLKVMAEDEQMSRESNDGDEGESIDRTTQKPQKRGSRAKKGSAGVIVREVSEDE